jgi:hypothetical protein
MFLCGLQIQQKSTEKSNMFLFVLLTLALTRIIVTVTLQGSKMRFVISHEKMTKHTKDMFISF